MNEGDISLIIEDFESALLQFDKEKATEIFLKAKNLDDKYVFDKLIIGALRIIGDKWEKDDVVLAQVYMSGRICEELVDKFMVDNSTSKRNNLPIGIATMGDHHLLGKKIIYSTLVSAGYDIIDYGHGLDADELVECIHEDKLKIILISALMHPTALKVKELRKKLKENEYNTKIVVGGAPFYLNPKLWKQVGADAMGKTSIDAMKIIDEL